MPRQSLSSDDDDSQPVMVPRNDKVLAPTSPERARRLRKHLVEALRELRTSKPRKPSSPPPRPDPDGFAGRVTQTACSMCKGWCCKGGGDHGYLDERTMGRVRSARPELDARGVLLLYVERVPTVGYNGSCVFHGKLGCTLDRSLRSDVCNSYFCAGLEAFLASGDVAAPVVVIAGERDHMRRSPVLMP